MVAAATAATALAAISAGLCAGLGLWETAEVCVLKSLIPVIKLVQRLVSRALGHVEAARNHIRAG